MNQKSILARLAAKKVYFLPFMLISLAIIATSFYYATYYPKSTSLPCSTASECMLSYATSMFNGYTETLTGLSFNNVYENASWAIAISLALPAVAILMGYEKYLNFALASIFVAQAIFVAVYPTYILPHLTNNVAFGGGLSLFCTYSLIYIVAFLVMHFYYIQKTDKIVDNKMQFIRLDGVPLFLFTEVFYVALSISNLITLLSSNQTWALIVSMAITIIAVLIIFAYIFFFIYKPYKRLAPKYHFDYRTLTIKTVIFSLMIGVFSAILLSSYLLPFFIFIKGLTLKGLLNPHNISLPFFVAVVLVLLKIKAFAPR